MSAARVADVPAVRIAAVEVADAGRRRSQRLGQRHPRDRGLGQRPRLGWTIAEGVDELALLGHEDDPEGARLVVNGTNAELQYKRADELARTKVGTEATRDARLADLEQAKGALTEANAALRDARIKLSYTEIRSPIGGRVGRAAASPGNLVGLETGILTTVVAEQPMRVLFSVTSAAAGSGAAAPREVAKGEDRLADDSLTMGRTLVHRRAGR
jgi:membrane fusion protein (multidrug efflux system)